MNKTLPQLFHWNDPERPKNAHCWPYVYLHGLAEIEMANLEERMGWECVAPDLFACDSPMPDTEGRYEVSLYGRPAVAVLAFTILPRLCGRIAFPDDEKGFSHACQPQDWGKR